MSVIQSGERFTLANITNTFDKLPKGNYMLKFDPREGYYLSKKEDFKLPKKIYGDHSIVNRWLKSWETNSEKNLGILLAGIKGSGKTITAQKFCIDSQLPVIIISEKFTDPDFIDFITSPKLGKSIVFVDEFEKVYPDVRDQGELLSIMDGNYSTSLIFLLTVNENKINEYLINRLNRIKYRKIYSDLEDDIMEEVINDLLVNKEHKDSIYKFFDKVNMCTFDLLVNLIKEMNLFNEDALQCGTHLNLKPNPKTYSVYEFINGREFLVSAINYAPGQETISVYRNTRDHLPQFSVERSMLEFQAQGMTEDNARLAAENLYEEHNEIYGWEYDINPVEWNMTSVNKGKIITFEHPVDNKYKVILREFNTPLIF